MDGECSVRLADKTVETAIIPSKATIDGVEYFVTSVAASGFTSSANLKKVRLPKTVKAVGNSAFANCKKLESITIPAVTSIGTSAFNLCTSLKELIIPKTVTSVGSTILRGTSTQVYVRASESETQEYGWTSNWNGNNSNQAVEYSSTFEPAVEYKEVVEQPLTRSTYSATPIGYIVDENQPFCEQDNYANVYIPAIYNGLPVIGIEQYAFGFNEIESLTIAYSEDPIYIKSYAFMGLSANTITINREVDFADLDDSFTNEINSAYVFDNSLAHTIILPNNITAIGVNMFYDCYNLTDIHFIAPQEGLSRAQEESIVDGLTSTRSVTLPSTVTTIEDEAFSGITEIENIYIPSTVVNVGSKILVNWGITNPNQSVIIDYEHESDLPIWNSTTSQGWNPTWKVSCNPSIIEFQGEYSIIYHLNGGQHSGNPGSYTPQDQITLNDAMRVGYSFDGWYETSDFTGERQYGISKGSSEDKVFYAKWIANSYSIVYNANKPLEASGSITGVTDTTEHDYDASSTLRANGFLLTGWSFAGWNTQDDGSGTAYANLASVTNLTSVNYAVITLFAQWTPNTYQISYSGNKPNSASGLLSGTMLDSSHTYDEEKTLTNNAYNLTGWHFVGWNTNADGSGISYEDGDYVSNLSSIKDSTVTLYAQWSNNEYTINFNGNKPNDASNVLTGNTLSSEHQYDVLKQLPINGYVLEGWRFTGWNTQSNGGGQAFTDGQSVLNLSSINDASITLFAIWEKNGFSVEYFGNKPSSASGQLTGSMQASTHEFDTTSQLTQNAFSISGWHFTGWNTSADGSGTNYTNEHEISNLTNENGGIISLYAQWAPNIYTVAFNGNKPAGSSNLVQGSMTNIPFIYEHSQTLSSNNYTLLGWIFSGWNTESDGSGISYTNGQSVANLTNINNATVTLYAQWTSNNYSIYYNGNKPSNASSAITGNTYNSTHKFDDPSNLTDNGFNITGWHFLYWTTNANGSGTKYENTQSILNLTSVKDETITLFAQWAPNSYTVEYDPNVPSTTNSVIQGSTSNSYFNYDTNYNLSQNGYTLTGYIFNGWKDASGVTYTDQESIENLTTTSSITLFAQWQAISYTIRYNINLPNNSGDYSGSTSSSQHYYDDSKSLSANGFNLQKWTFKSWNTMANGNGTSYNNRAAVKNLTSVNGDIVDLYAIWTQRHVITFDGSQGYSGYEDGTIPVPFGIEYRYGDLNATITIPPIIYNGYKFAWHEYKNGVKTGAVYLDNSSYTVTGDATLIAIRTEKTLNECEWATNCYDIYTVNQMNQLRDQPNYGKDRSYSIQNDLTLSNWVPIPLFKGRLSGDRHISITIQSFNTASVGAYVGGLITENQGHLQYLNVTANITAKSTDIQAVGIIIGNNSSGGYIIESRSYGSIDCYTSTASLGHVGVNSGTIISSVINYASINKTAPPSDPCVATGTLITLADGSQVPVETLTGNEMLLVWNFNTGTFGAAPILFIDNDPIKSYEIINLYFSDGTQVKVIYEHGFWDCTLNKYVYLRNDAAQYIGHYFNKQSVSNNGDLTWTQVKLINVVITVEQTAAWSPVTHEYLCYYVNGMLSMPGKTESFVNIFDVDEETMQYDQDALLADIATYGLFTYDEFIQHIDISEDVFNAFGGQYLKIAIAKGITDWDTINELIAIYADFLN